jgi:hypothetical protein
MRYDARAKEGSMSRGRTYTVLTAAFAAGLAGSVGGQPAKEWAIHDMNRPVPPVVEPGASSTNAQPGKPPSDAIPLFEGTGLDRWQGVKGGPAKWTLGAGYFEVAKGAGDLQTKQGFGDCQLHVEWAAPVPAVGEGQERGNSGVYLMGLYEVQVLDSYDNRTYADGQAAAIYGQSPPLVNASRPPGQWQTYDIIFHRPRFDSSGAVTRPARITVFHNGLLVQENFELSGPTAHQRRPPYQAHPDKLPLSLQDHGNPVRYRNIWIRALRES